jgi:hypothetical protein
LNQDLSTHASVDTREKDLVPVVVNEVHSGEADQRLAAVDVLPVVVGVGDVELALILGTVVIGMADERGLPLSRFGKQICHISACI